jgi:predicted nucleic acid-binding protein
MPAPHILVDTSIWIDHLNKGDEGLADLLKRRRLLMHPMIVGEIALGSTKKQAFMLDDLNALPQLAVVSHPEVLAMIGWLKLGGSGVGYVDAHLLAAIRQISNGRIWTRDKRLRAQTERLDVAFQP